MDSDRPVLIGVSRVSPPPPSAVSMLAPERTISTRELDAIERPCVVLGGPPCVHWRDATNARNDLLYVVVPVAGEGRAPAPGDVVLPSAHPAAIRRHLQHLLYLKQRYLGSLPKLTPTSFSWKGHEVALTPTESNLLQVMYDHEGEIVGRDELARIANCPSQASRALDAHIHRLRSKLAIPGVELRTERQRGFRLTLA